MKHDVSVKLGLSVLRAKKGDHAIMGGACYIHCGSYWRRCR